MMLCFPKARARMVPRSMACHTTNRLPAAMVLAFLPQPGRCLARCAPLSHVCWFGYGQTLCLINAPLCAVGACQRRNDLQSHIFEAPARCCKGKIKTCRSNKTAPVCTPHRDSLLRPNKGRKSHRCIRSRSCHLYLVFGIYRLGYRFGFA